MLGRVKNGMLEGMGTGVPRAYLRWTRGCMDNSLEKTQAIFRCPLCATQRLLTMKSQSWLRFAACNAAKNRCIERNGFFSTVPAIEPVRIRPVYGCIQSIPVPKRLARWENSSLIRRFPLMNTGFYSRIVAAVRLYQQKFPGGQCT